VKERSRFEGVPDDSVEKEEGSHDIVKLMAIFNWINNWGGGGRGGGRERGGGDGVRRRSGSVRGWGGSGKWDE
jgi:hypothetical protein